MSDTVIKYQCPSCGAPLEFSPEKQMLICNSCDSEFSELSSGDIDIKELDFKDTEEDINWRIEGLMQNKEVLENQVAYSCTSCGAQILSDGNTVATECVYCKNPVVLAENVSGLLKPDMVVPFKITKEEAEKILYGFYANKKLLPNEFKNQNHVSKITGMYVPFWLFSCTGDGRARFKATKVRSWSDSRYKYTQTKTYEIEREGEMDFVKIPTDASSKMDDNYMGGLEPYDYGAAREFSPNYMAGYFADKFDVGVDESTPIINDRVMMSVVEALKSTVNGYSSVNCERKNVQMVGEDIKYALLPVWMLNTKYKGEIFEFAINGQTGKVSGRLPIDKTKLFLYSLSSFSITALITGAIAAFVILF